MDRHTTTTTTTTKNDHDDDKGEEGGEEGSALWRIASEGRGAGALAEGQGSGFGGWKTRANKNQGLVFHIHSNRVKDDVHSRMHAFI